MGTCSQAQEYHDFAHFMRETDPSLTVTILANQNLASAGRTLTARQKVRQSWGDSNNPPHLLPKDLEPSEWSIGFSEALANFVRTGITREYGERILRLAKHERTGAMAALGRTFNDELLKCDIGLGFRKCYPPQSTGNAAISE